MDTTLLNRVLVECHGCSDRRTSFLLRLLVRGLGNTHVHAHIAIKLPYEATPHLPMLTKVRMSLCVYLYVCAEPT